jgi:hypothetical protein
MAHSKKQGIDTGNGSTKTPILASVSVPMAGALKQSPPLTSIAEGSTKPVSVTEALSLLQTLCLDLRSLGCETAILARKNRLYIISNIPASIGKIAMDEGHITIDGLPVLLGDTGKRDSVLCDGGEGQT